jgi:hypothetical protein
MYSEDCVLVETRRNQWEFMHPDCAEAYDTETDDDEYNDPRRGQAQDFNRR